MEENFQPEKINVNDVIEYENNTYKIAKVLDKLKIIFLKKLGETISYSLKEEKIDIYPDFQNKQRQWDNWFDRGIDCEVLKIDANFFSESIEPKI